MKVIRNDSDLEEYKRTTINSFKDLFILIVAAAILFVLYCIFRLLIHLPLIYIIFMWILAMWYIKDREDDQRHNELIEALKKH